jgi:hypothetical protein
VSPRLGMDEPELAAPAEAGDRRSRQPLAKIRRKFAAKIRPAKLDACDTAIDEHLLETSYGRFDFGQLGHGGDMAKVDAAS